MAQIKFKLAILKVYKRSRLFYEKLLLLPLVIFAFTAEAYIIDYNAINDDDKAINFLELTVLTILLMVTKRTIRT